MPNSYLNNFSKSILTAVFLGILTTVICLTYNAIFREITGFYLSSYINVSTLIFGVNIVFLIIGFIYYGFVQSNNKGENIFIVLFSLLTIFLGWQSMIVNRSPDPKINLQFHELLLGVVIIIGVMASFGIPFLFHNKKFEDTVL